MQQRQSPREKNIIPVLLLYFMIFWIILPGVFIVFGILLDRLFGLSGIPGMKHFAPFILSAGVIIYGSSAYHLKKTGKGLPISAIPPVHLVETGPYALSRHPLYIGFHLIFLGSIGFACTAGLLISCGPFFLIIWIIYAVLIEEPGLIKRFGKIYLRYREETNLLLPDFYSIATYVLLPYLRIFLRLRIIDKQTFPDTGGFFFVAHHRSYLDPFIFAAATRRKIHYLTTSSMFRTKYLSLFFKKLNCIPLKRYVSDISAIRKTLAVINSGGVVGIFPEGGRSWYGESAWTNAVFTILRKAGVPVVWGELAGGYDYFPRFSRKILPVRLRTRFFIRDSSSDPAASAKRIKKREEKRDSLLRAEIHPLKHRSFSMLFFRCPSCGKYFTVRYFYDGAVLCDSCRETWQLIQGKGAVNSKGEILSLSEYEKMVPGYCSKEAAQGLYIRCTIKKDFKVPEKAVLTLEDNKCILTFTASDRTSQITHNLYYEKITAVMIEGRKKLEMAVRQDGSIHLYSCAVPQKYAYFLQSFIRLKAFGNIYTRHRGSTRIPV